MSGAKTKRTYGCFGLLVDANTISNGNYILKSKPDQGNLGKGFKKGESRQISSSVGKITAPVNLINLGSKQLALLGIIMLAWEEDNTPNAKVVQAYNDSVTILKQHVSNRVRNLNTGPLTQAEIDAVKSDLKKVIEKRFKSAVHWYNPFSWDPDDFIGFAQMVEAVEAGRSLVGPVDFTFKGDDAKYQVLGQLRFIP